MLKDQLTMQSPTQEPANTPGLPVKGYKTTQPDWAIRQVNVLKVYEELYLRQLDGLIHMGEAVDQRSIALAKTYLQTAAMWAARAVFQPQRLTDDELPTSLPGLAPTPNPNGPTTNPSSGSEDGHSEEDT